MSAFEKPLGNVYSDHSNTELASELARIEGLLDRIETAFGNMPGMATNVLRTQTRTPAARLNAIAVNVERMQGVATDAFNALESAQAELRQIKSEVAAAGRLLKRMLSD